MLASKELGRNYTQIYFPIYIYMPPSFPYSCVTCTWLLTCICLCPCKMVITGSLQLLCWWCFLPNLTYTHGGHHPQLELVVFSYKPSCTFTEVNKHIWAKCNLHCGSHSDGSGSEGAVCACTYIYSMCVDVCIRMYT